MKVLSFKNNNKIILYSILLLGLCLRLYNITYRGIWLDEGISIKWAGLDIPSMIINTAIDVHPPFYYLVLHYWMLIFGDSEFAVRLLSTIAGVLTIAAVYKIAKYLFNEKTALISAFLVSISALHIRYAQETRGYTIVALLSVLSVYYFLKFINSEKEKSYPYFIVSIALIYTHAYGLVIIFTEAIFYYLYLLLKKPFTNKTKNINWSFAKIALSYLPWIPVMIFQLFKVQSGFAFWIKQPDSKTLLMTFLQHSGSIFNRLTYITLFLFALLLVFAVVKGGGKEQSAIRKPSKSEAARPVLLLLLWFLFPIISLFIVSQKAHSVFDIKSTIAFSAPFLILVSYGINKISNNLLRAGLLAIIIFLSAASLNTLYYSTRETKEQWREACNYLKNKCKADETIIVDPGYYKRFTFDYYFRNPVNKILTHEKTNMLNKDIISAANFENSGKFWLIASTDDNYKLFDYFKKIRLNITDSRTYKGVVIYAFEKNAAQE